MADKPSRFHQNIKTHGSPEKQIGTTADGKPIWIDVRELISSPDEDAERWSKTMDSRKAAAIDNMAKLVLKNAALFIEQTIYNISGDSVKKLYFEGDSKALFQCCLQHNIEAIQDGLTTVVKHRGKVIRDMTAKIEPAWRDQVARRVNYLVKKLPAQIA